MKISKELLKGSTSIMILKVISEGDSYGYQIVQILYKRSNNFFKLNEGTLYPFENRMTEELLDNKVGFETAKENIIKSPRGVNCI